MYLEKGFMQSVWLSFAAWIPRESLRQGIGELWVGNPEPGHSTLCRKATVGGGRHRLGVKRDCLETLLCHLPLCNHVEVTFFWVSVFNFISNNPYLEGLSWESALRPYINARCHHCCVTYSCHHYASPIFLLYHKDETHLPYWDIVSISK